MLSQPLDSRQPVVNRSRKPILRRKPVVRRDDKGLEVQSETEAVVLAVGPRAGADAEAAAVDVEEYGKLGRRRRGRGRFIEAEMEAMEGVENDVFPGD